MRVLISLMGWFNPSSSPYITKGVTDTDIRYIVNVNPNNQQSIPILRSVNARKGINLHIQFGYILMMKEKAMIVNMK